MTQIEDLLRQALTETPVTTTTFDPVGALDRRVRRARRRLAVGAGVAVAAVVAAVAVPLATIGGGHDAGVQVGHSPAPAPSSGPPAVWLAGGGHGVASNDGRGHSFVVSDHGAGATRRLVELDAKGAEVRHFTVPGSALFVAQRDGIAWVWGGGDGASPTATVTAVDVHNGAMSSVALPQYGAVSSLAVAQGGVAWAVVADHVLRIELSAGKAKVAEEVPLAGAQRIVVTTQGDLWVQADTRLVDLVPGGDGPGVASLAASVHWTGGALLAATGSRYDRLWVQTGPRQVGILDPLVGMATANVDGQVTSQIDVPGRPSAVAEDGIGGLYVALEGGGLVFYNFAAVPKGGPPTNELARSTVDVETMAPTLDGGVIMQDFGGTVLHWHPRTS